MMELYKYNVTVTKKGYCDLSATCQKPRFVHAVYGLTGFGLQNTKKFADFIASDENGEYILENISCGPNLNSLLRLLFGENIDSKSESINNETL